MKELLQHDYKFIFSNMRIIILISIVTPFLLNINSTQYLLNHTLLLIILICGGSNQTSGMLLNSLPQNKKEIVKSRYIFMGTNSLFITLCLLLLGFLLGPREYNIFFSEFKNILGFYYCILMFTALILPLSFMFSGSGSALAMMLAFMFLNAYMYLIYLNVIDYILVWTFIIIIWVVSTFYASLSIFNEREFD